MPTRHNQTAAPVGSSSHYITMPAFANCISFDTLNQVLNNLDPKSQIVGFSETKYSIFLQNGSFLHGV